MSIVNRTRLVNPRLGTYFGIFVSLLASIVLLSLVAEQLGTPDYIVRWAMLLAPFALYAGIGIASHTEEQSDYFTAGRRVPPFFAGLGLAITSVGGVGIVCLTGVFLVNGIDGWSIVNGVVGGLVVSATMIAPYFRKFGAYSVPSYLGRRFDNRVVRVTAAMVLAVPLLLVLIAEVKVGIAVTAELTGAPALQLGLIFALTVMLTLAPGGMRSLSWAGAAAGLAALLALAVPAAIVAIDATNLPIAQFSYGPVLRAVGRLENAQGLPIPILSPMAFDLAGTSFEALTRRMSHPFGSIGPASYVLTALALSAGVAVAPWLLPRTTTTPGVYETRKSLGWAVCVVGVLVLTTSAMAVFLRDIVLDQLVGRASTQLPKWFEMLSVSGATAVDGRLPKLPLQSFSFKRDSVLFALPVAAQLPAVIVYLTFAGAAAASFAAASAATLALGTLLAEDGFNGSRWELTAQSARLIITRIALAVVAAFGTLFALVLPADPLKLVLWAFGLSGAAVFPVIALSIWWKRLSSFGALLGIVTGFGSGVLAILASEAAWFGVPSEFVCVFAIPAAATAAIIATLVRPTPPRHVLEMVRDMRVPGGETVYDRELRLARLKRRQVPQG